MKTTKEKADELVDAYRTYIRKADVYDNLVVEDEKFIAIQCAILSVKHTIEVLKEVNDLTIIDRAIVNAIDEQTELLTELESRV
jgi:hypothetical protein